MTPTTLKEMAEEIERRAGVEISALPITSQYVWFNNPKGDPTQFKIGEECPLSGSGAIVLGLFENDTEMRVYAVQPGSDPTSASPPLRFSLHKTSPTFSTAQMGFDLFLDEMASEWSVVASDVTTAEKERELVVEFLRSQGPAIFAVDAADLIEAGAHEEDDEDDEEETPPAPTVPDVSAATPPAPADKPS